MNREKSKADTMMRIREVLISGYAQQSIQFGRHRRRNNAFVDGVQVHGTEDDVFENSS